ncbi:CYTH domain-containing protein [Pusillimonas sp.]|uniref:CYTH domain-containing protein n=1 Tax=Pusillimonas sp. TaxID=3040095 RepID=UPI0037CC35BB
MHGKKAHGIALRALYFDTASRALARAGIALRVRREGGQWVQTLKAAGHDPLSRIEINHPRPHAQIDLTLYKEGPLANFFAKLNEPLKVRYETDVQRLVAQAGRDGTLIEIAYDEGAILAQGWTLPVCEVEFELVSGDMSALFDLAQEWLSRHGLILEIRSKAQRGDRLADLEPAPATAAAMPPALFEARRAKRPNVAANATVSERYIAHVGESLVQIMANASLLAGVDARNVSDEDRAAQLHQLKLGIRRLRACWKRYPALAPDIEPPIAQALARKRPDQLQAIAAGPEFQLILLGLLKQLVHLGDSERLETSGA